MGYDFLWRIDIRRSFIFDWILSYYQKEIWPLHGKLYSYLCSFLHCDCPRIWKNRLLLSGVLLWKRDRFMDRCSISWDGFKSNSYKHHGGYIPFDSWRFIDIHIAIENIQMVIPNIFIWILNMEVHY